MKAQMMIVHRSGELLQDGAPTKHRKARGKSARQMRVQLWIARQYEKDYRDALKEYAADIAEIQKTEPGWMPTRAEF